jgi:TonB family protein
MKYQFRFHLFLLAVGAAFCVNGQTTALFQAARSGDLVTLNQELSQGADVNAENLLGETALIYAVEACKSEAVQELIKAGAKTDFMTKLGYSPLIIAASNGCTEIVRILLDAKVDVNREDSKQRYNALLKAVEFNHIDIVELLLSRGTPVNYHNTYGITPLMAAAQKGHRAIVELLLSRKAEVNAKTLIDYTPLLYALEFNQPEIVVMLLDAGANAKDADNYNKSALMSAAGMGNADLVQLLIEKGADVNAKTDKGETALAVANKKKFTGIVTFLIEKGADTTGVKIAVDSTAQVAEDSLKKTSTAEVEIAVTPPEPVGGLESIQKRLRYPKKAKEAGVEGEITLEVTINRIAQIKSIKIVKSFNNKECEKAAENAVRATRWKVAKKGKKTVEASTTIILQFKLDKPG